MLYNFNFINDEEIKWKFGNLYESDSVKNVIFSRLKSIDEYETGCEKKILEWTSKEIEDYFRFLNSKSRTSVYNYFITLKEYANFVWKETRENNDSVLPNFLSDIVMFDFHSMKNLTNERKCNEGYLSDEDYAEIISSDDLLPFAKVLTILFYHCVPINKIDDIFSIDKSIIDYDNKRIRTTLACEWLDLTDGEMNILNSFEADQSYPSEYFNGFMYAVVETGTEASYLCECNSSRIFHPVVAFSMPTPGGIRFRPISDNDKPLTFARGTARRVFTEMSVILDRKALRPKNIIKSGCMNRLVEEFSITKEIIGDGVVAKQDWKEFVNGACSFKMEEVRMACKL